MAQPPQRARNPEQLTEKLSISELRLFDLVVQQGSFSGAAKFQGLSQPTVSKRIKRLEAMVGQPLIERSARQLELTEVGARFLVHCRQLLKEFDATVSYIVDQREQPSGELTVCLGLGAFTMLGGACFSEFMQKYPSVTLSLVEPSEATLYGTPGADIILSQVLLPGRKLQKVELIKYQVHFYASRDYLKQQPNFTHPRELINQQCLCPRISFLQPDFQPGEWFWTDESGERQSIIIQPKSWVESLVMAIELAKNGAGVIICPEVLLESQDKEKQLVKVFAGKFSTQLTLYAMFKDTQVVPSKVQAFIDALRHALATKSS